MRLRILLVALISTTLAQQQDAERPARTPQAQIKYDDPNGSKVDWKLFAHQNRWHAQLENSQRAQRDQAEPIHSQQSVQRPVQSQLIQSQPDYNQAQYRQYLQAQPTVEAQQDINQIQYKQYQQAQYNVEEQPDPNQYSAYSQAQSHSEEQPNPNQLQYSAYQQAQSPVNVQPDSNQIEYKPFANLPSYVKQAVLANFNPQRPRVQLPHLDYNSQLQEQQPENAVYPSQEQQSESYEHLDQQKSRREYSDGGLQGRIVYKNDYYQPEQQQAPHVPSLIEKLMVSQPPKINVHPNTPIGIQRLLQYQAESPYNVIANSISNKQKMTFVPEQLPNNIKGYRSRVYYLNRGRFVPEDETKPVQEHHRF